MPHEISNASGKAGLSQQQTIQHQNSIKKPKKNVDEIPLSKSGINTPNPQYSVNDIDGDKLTQALLADIDDDDDGEIDFEPLTKPPVMPETKTPEQKKIEQLEAQLNNAHKTNKELRSENNKLNFQIDKLTDKLNEIANTIDDKINSALQGANSKINELTDRLNQQQSAPPHQQNQQYNQQPQNQQYNMQNPPQFGGMPIPQYQYPNYMTPPMLPMTFGGFPQQKQGSKGWADRMIEKAFDLAPKLLYGSPDSDFMQSALPMQYSPYGGISMQPMPFYNQPAMNNNMQGQMQYSQGNPFNNIYPQGNANIYQPQQQTFQPQQQNASYLDASINSLGGNFSTPKTRGNSHDIPQIPNPFTNIKMNQILATNIKELKQQTKITDNNELIERLSKDFKNNQKSDGFNDDIKHAKTTDMKMRGLNTENYDKIIDSIIKEVFELPPSTIITDVHKNAYEFLLLIANNSQIEKEQGNDIEEDDEDTDIQNPTDNKDGIVGDKGQQNPDDLQKILAQLMNGAKNPDGKDDVIEGDDKGTKPKPTTTVGAKPVSIEEDEEDIDDKGSEPKPTPTVTTKLPEVDKTNTNDGTTSTVTTTTPQKTPTVIA